ncbi:MAG: hypothetical protein V3W36_00490, partial [Acidimicrobiia bacterium]
MSDVWRNTVDFFDRFPYLEALAIVGLFVLLAWLFDRMLIGFLRRLVNRSETEFDDKLLDLLHRPIFTTVGLVAFLLKSILNLIILPEGIVKPKGPGPGAEAVLS